MMDKVGEVYEGRVSGFAGSGIYAVLDEPFVDVLLRFEALGPDRYEPSDDGLSVVGRRSGDRISLGDRVTLVVEDVALLRRTIYGRRVPPADAFFTGAEPVSTEIESPRPRHGGPRRERFEPTPALDGTGRGRASKGKRGVRRRGRDGEVQSDFEVPTRGGPLRGGAIRGGPLREGVPRGGGRRGGGRGERSPLGKQRGRRKR
jgi:ribonuclease R